MNLLAFDTSTEVLTVAVQRTGGQRWHYQGAGGPQSSAALIPAVLRLLGEAGLTLGELRAIVFGRGPGSFTGLRTACSVAQGLAFGASVPVLPVDTLLAVAEAARRAGGATHLLALLDARMGELYSGLYVHESGTWKALGDLAVGPPEALALPIESAADTPGWVLAGNAFAPEYAERLPAALASLPRIPVSPTADALLDLAPGLLAAGLALPADQALPLYIRDKVAHTTAERAAQASGAR